jgi:6-phosphogluconolactonase (cycloisomerase 2 family)
MRKAGTSRLAFAAAAIVAVGIFAFGPRAGAARLVSVTDIAAGMCTMPPDPSEARADWIDRWQQNDILTRQLAQQPTMLLEALAQGVPERQRTPERRRIAQLPALREIARKPEPRVLGDTYPTFTAIGVYTPLNQIVIQDNNLWSTWIFNRTDNSAAPSAPPTKPKTIIQGDDTHIQFNNGIYIDQENGDIYSVESDTGDKMLVFGIEASGNATPKRLLHTPHRVYGIAVDEARDELFITVENPAEIVVYKKSAIGEDQPIRRIAGPRTQLHAPHGVVVDEKNQLLYVNHWGQAADFRTPGTGQFLEPAINVYPLNADGDVEPIRVISGSRTQLNWPGNMALDKATGDLYVANDMGQSVLVFTGLAYVRGNVPPTRVIKGDRTKLLNPTGVAVDAENQELWVANLGSASAVAFPLKANGNVAPLRVVRAAPDGHRNLTFGRTAAVAYDSNREELLVPN